MDASKMRQLVKSCRLQQSLDQEAFCSQQTNSNGWSDHALIGPGLYSPSEARQAGRQKNGKYTRLPGLADCAIYRQNDFDSKLDFKPLPCNLQPYYMQVYPPPELVTLIVMRVVSYNHQSPH
ncbi:hypothetical protein VTN77DRAFT_980 [Rasamsonia byssochlamydoides]|uniref:uncharacterized protein n=1 Tax=Rasamsonia byssochlamydoides TaxID=89139 RepID=UPI0037428AA4